MGRIGSRIPAVGGITNLSQLVIDETGRMIVAQPIDVDGVTRTIPARHHVTYLTAHKKKLTVKNGGKLEVDGSLTVVDLGD